MMDTNLEKLAERVERFDTKVQRIIDNRGMELSTGGQATAIAMLVTLDLPLFAEVAAVLRALAQFPQGER